MQGICKNEKHNLSAAPACSRQPSLRGQLRNYAEPGMLMGVKTPVLPKAKDTEEGKCGFVGHFNPKPTLIKCSRVTFTECSERHQLSVSLSSSAMGDTELFLVSQLFHIFISNKISKSATGVPKI